MDTRAYQHTHQGMPQLYTILRISCLFWLIAKVLSMKTWVAERLYPLVPVFDFTSTVAPQVHRMLFYISCACILALMVFPKRRDLLVFLLISELFSCLLDITRWQPWEYQYVFTLFIFLFHKNNPKALYTGFVFLMASVYVFSGLHKINGGFLHSVWEKMILRRFFELDRETISGLHLHYAGLLLPALEVVFGLGLLFLKKKWPALGLIGMHLFLLLLLGPAGLDHNVIVWPWNAAMILLLHTLFMGKHGLAFSFRYMVHRWNVAILLFWGILPMLSFAGHWDQYLSSGLYSGTALQMRICLDDENAVPELEKYVSNKTTGTSCTYRISLQKWSLDELKVPPYPEKWYYARLRKKWMEKYIAPGSRFMLYQYPYKHYEEMR